MITGTLFTLFLSLAGQNECRPYEYLRIVPTGGQTLEVRCHSTSIIRDAEALAQKKCVGNEEIDWHLTSLLDKTVEVYRKSDRFEQRRLIQDAAYLTAINQLAMNIATCIPRLVDKVTRLTNQFNTQPYKAGLVEFALNSYEAELKSMKDRNSLERFTERILTEYQESHQGRQWALAQSSRFLSILRSTLELYHPTPVMKENILQLLVQLKPELTVEMALQLPK